MSFSFAQMALVAGTLIGLTTAYLGLFVVLRRVVFVGASLAQLASAGVALSLFLDWPLGLGAAFTLLCGVGLFSLEGARRRLPGEALIGV
ncbi:MAG TPA: metal ABC transporter permease, partial [Candidatus Nitrosotenuis sp.]|nr:metal ABC transporter permease [Candidatus Nitrosotenuis sp.]